MVFENARYPYLVTVTCAGHATIGTGALPHRHGMINNTWWLRKERRLIGALRSGVDRHHLRASDPAREQRGQPADANARRRTARAEARRARRLGVDEGAQRDLLAGRPPTPSCGSTILRIVGDINGVCPGPYWRSRSSSKNPYEKDLGPRVDAVRLPESPT